ncbi:ABC transporter permease [Piscinibacter sakaiensis]|uniref:ABC transporter permease n=1 Tax=Piscinibacter sakaiensis TaxID=1547922 RepID=UPI003AB0208C
MSRVMGRLRQEPLLWALPGLLLLAAGMPLLKPVFAALFPQLQRPMYEQDSFLALLAAHAGLVAASSAAAVLVGVAAGWFVTRSVGREFRPLVEMATAIGQTVPPVAVLAVAAPLIGFGAWPALIALALYGVLPVLRGSVAGFESVSPHVLEAARGQGLTGWQLLRSVEWPLAAPVLLAGVRTSVVINIGTAAIASTVGARTLGTPIVIGLSGFNTAYVLQGAVLAGALAIVTDMAFARLGRHLQRWRDAA